MSEAGAERRHGPLFEPENELEEAMLAALLDPGAMDGFLSVLAGHQVLIPLNPKPPSRKPSVGELRVPVVEYEGRRGVPAYTSSGQLAAAMSGEVRCLRFTGGQLGRAWGPDETSLLLNPGGALGLEVSADTLRGLPEAAP